MQDTARIEAGFELGGEFHALGYNQGYYYSLIIIS
jgi:hypothetical protein